MHAPPEQMDDDPPEQMDDDYLPYEDEHAWQGDEDDVPANEIAGEDGTLDPDFVWTDERDAGLQEGLNGDFDDEAEEDIAQMMNSLLLAPPVGGSDLVEEQLEDLHEATYSRITHSEYYPNAGKIIGKWHDFLQKWRTDDPNAELRETEPFYTFKSFEEWEFTNLLFRMPCSMAWKNDLLATSIVSERTKIRKGADCIRSR